MACSYFCNQKRRELGTAIKTGNFRAAVKAAATGTGAILGLIPKDGPETPTPAPKPGVGTLLGRRD